MRNERNFMWSVRALALGALVVAGFLFAPSQASAALILDTSSYGSFGQRSSWGGTLGDNSGTTPGMFIALNGQSVGVLGVYMVDNGSLDISSVFFNCGSNQVEHTFTDVHDGWNYVEIDNVFPADVSVCGVSMPNSQTTSESGDVFTISVPGAGARTQWYTGSLSDNGLDATRIISITPPYASTTGYTVTYGATVYVAPEDWSDDLVLSVRFVNNTLQNGIGGSALDAWNAAFGDLTFPLSSGNNVISASTTFDRIGQVNWDLQIEAPNETWLIGSLLPDRILTSTTSIFYVVQPTGLDIALASTTDVLVSALITGTTTQSVVRCNPVDFDITVCLMSLLIPPMSVIEHDMQVFRDDFLTRVPMGYVTRFYAILTASTSELMPVFSVTVPAVLPGHGASMSLDFNHALDPLLESTASPYGTSTATFYETTSYYWELMVYLALVFYIISRVIGAHLFGNPFSYDSVDLGEDVKRAEKRDNMLLGRKIFYQRNRRNRKNK